MNWKKFQRKARRWFRKYRVYLLAVCVLAAIVLLISMSGGEPEYPKTYDGFLDALGMRESSNDYTVVNRFHYMGRYQMGEPALKDAGFMDDDGNWTKRAHSYGIYSEDDFLNSPDGQDAAVRAYHTKLCSYFRGYNMEKYIGTTYCGVEVTRSGMLAACHLVGFGSLKRALASGEPAYDGNGTPASEYMELFAGYDIAEIWEKKE